MTDEFDVIRGNGNVFRDFGHANADANLLKTILAAPIIEVLDQRELTVRAAILPRSGHRLVAPG